MATPTSGILERRLISRPVTDLAYRAMLNLGIAYVHWEVDFAACVGREGLSPSSYNVLRILKGHSEGHPRREISRRMLYLAADVTRIIDRLKQRGLVERARSATDRRLSVTRLTAKGHKVMDKLEGPVFALMHRYGKKMSERDLEEFNRLLEAIYVDKLE
jgi:DNA-binding MarR family transcriptional regulator